MKARTPTLIAAVFAGVVFSLGLMGCPSSSNDDPEPTSTDITTIPAVTGTANEANYTLKVPVTGGSYTAAAKTLSNWTLEGGTGSSRAAVAPALVILSKDSKEAYLSGAAIVPGVKVTKIKAAAITAGAKVGTPAWAAPPASTATTDLTSAAFASKVGDAVLTVTLKDGTFLSAEPLLSYFTIDGGTAGFALTGGVVTRDSANPSVAVITGLTPVSTAGAAQTLKIKSAAVSLGTTTITSVVAGAPVAITATGAAYNASTGILTISGTGFSTTAAVDVSKITIGDGTGTNLTLSAGTGATPSTTSAAVVTNATTVTITLTIAGKTAFEAAGTDFDQNGSISGALKLEADWLTGAPAATGLTIVVTGYSGNGQSQADVTAAVTLTAAHNTITLTAGQGGQFASYSAANFVFSPALTINSGGPAANPAAGAAAPMILHFTAGAANLGAYTITIKVAAFTSAAIVTSVTAVPSDSTAAPTPAVTGAAYIADTGVLTITGSGFPTDTDDVDVTKVTLGGTALTAASSATSTTASAIVITVGGADKTGVTFATGGLVTGGLVLEADYVPGGAAGTCDVTVTLPFTAPLTTSAESEDLTAAEPKLLGTVDIANTSISAGATLDSLTSGNKTGFKVLLTKTAAQTVTPGTNSGTLTAATVGTTAISTGTAVEIPVTLADADFADGTVIFDLEVSESGKSSITHTVTVTFN